MANEKVRKTFTGVVHKYTVLSILYFLLSHKIYMNKEIQKNMV